MPFNLGSRIAPHAMAGVAAFCHRHDLLFQLTPSQPSHAEIFAIARREASSTFAFHFDHASTRMNDRLSYPDAIDAAHFRPRP